MPYIYIAPSMNEENRFAGGGSEKQYSNMLADHMEPFLRSCGVYFVRSEHQDIRESIEQANGENTDLFVSLRSTASPPGMYGHQRGCTVQYYLTSEEGRHAAELIARNLKNIYPIPAKVRACASVTQPELKYTSAPAVVLEYGFHDNEEDAQWIRENTQLIAKNLMQSLTRYFKIPFIHAQAVRYGVVSTLMLPLNIRIRPNNQTKILARAARGDKISIFGRAGDWYVVEYEGIKGYANAHYIRV